MRGKSQSGWLLVELLAGLSILTVLLAGLAVSQASLARFNAWQLARQRCLAAADAEMESLAATGKPLPQDKLDRLWPEVQITVSRQDGVGDWAGLTLVKIVVAAESKGRPVRVELARYVRAEEKK
jgi:type II secretory pathway pseudopilin PulG